jgi:hypothetical protein
MFKFFFLLVLYFLVKEFLEINEIPNYKTFINLSNKLF